jgi:hypothetical protein
MIESLTLNKSDMFAPSYRNTLLRNRTEDKNDAIVAFEDSRTRVFMEIMALHKSSIKKVAETLVDPEMKSFYKRFAIDLIVMEAQRDIDDLYFTDDKDIVGKGTIIVALHDKIIQAIESRIYLHNKIQSDYIRSKMVDEAELELDVAMAERDADILRFSGK